MRSHIIRDISKQLRVSIEAKRRQARDLQQMAAELEAEADVLAKQLAKMDLR